MKPPIYDKHGKLNKGWIVEDDRYVYMPQLDSRLDDEAERREQEKIDRYNRGR